MLTLEIRLALALKGGIGVPGSFHLAPPAILR